MENYFNLKATENSHTKNAWNRCFPFLNAETESVWDVENYLNLEQLKIHIWKMHGIDVSHFECCDIRCLRYEKLFEFKIHIWKMHELDVEIYLNLWATKDSCMKNA